jgi:uncharacterized protein (DUF433 family)
MVTKSVDTINISVGISQSTKDWLAEQGEQFDMPQDQIVEWLIEESVRMRRFPRIGFREEGPRRRACIRGSRFDVWWIIDTLRETSREHVLELLEESGRSRHDLEAVERYYACYADEIDPWIEEHHQPVEYWQAKYPQLNIEVVEV